MQISAYASRLATYCSRHGFRATAQRAIVALRRALFANRQIVFYCDLTSFTSPCESLPDSLRVERKRAVDELDAQDLRQMVEFWNPRLAQQRIQERFGKGSSLWVIKHDNKLAGYGWTLRGNTIAPYYFPMAEQDVQFFDFHVFPKFRGRAIDWFLMTHVLGVLATEGRGRAYAEAGEWNRSSLSSLTLTPFRRLGQVRLIRFLGHEMVCWSGNESTAQVRKGLRQSFVMQTPHFRAAASDPLNHPSDRSRRDRAEN